MKCGKSNTLNARMGTGGNQIPIVFGIGRDAFNQGENSKFGITIEENKQPTILAKGAGAVCEIQSGVRRYTPKECERLQGLPDNFTLISDKTCSDAARYRAIGNGMAQPCADWIIKRITEVTKTNGDQC